MSGNWKFTLFLLLYLWANDIRAQSYFDPSVDTIAFTGRSGLWKMVVPDKVLLESALKAHPDLCEVTDIRIQDIHAKPYIFFRGKTCAKPDLGYTLMVQLKSVGYNAWMAGDIFQCCSGVLCSACGFDEYWGCACERYDGPPDDNSGTFCKHSITLGPGLVKVEYPQK